MKMERLRIAQYLSAGRARREDGIGTDAGHAVALRGEAKLGYPDGDSDAAEADGPQPSLQAIQRGDFPCRG